MTRLKFKRENKTFTLIQNTRKEIFQIEEVKNILNEIRHPFEIAICGTGTENDENYFNSAAIIRTAHIFLVKKIHLIDRPSFYKRATMGTHGFENIEYNSLSSFIEKYSNRNLVCFERRTTLSSETLYDFKYPKDPILIFGSEKFGIPDKLIKITKHIVTIEQYGLHNDLNVAVASAIAMYDFLNKFYRYREKNDKQQNRTSKISN